jgi:CRP/FNR family transcriptional regulator, cyclic AMP receptor protein
MYEELLARVPLFQELAHRELRWLGDACREREYTAGQVLVRQGGGSVGLVVVVAGSVRVTERAADGIEHELGRLEAGAIWGETALLEEAPCPVTLTALEPTQVIVLPIWDFRTTLRESPDLAIHLLAVLSRRLHEGPPGERQES